ncbi:phosphatidylinositol 3,4,5-trisphosphate 3-phosphatase and protein-tyrosine-phosphatase PTEN2A-like [Telopea speciosissima]|uniref:phosphatidylinositol 3,4,5-trisphosphate 3-phosphatase and protein-tyrosine-phosphatase PTEN2A-like n=1 Tax=Telopea speciosissima TaxID=54955 RepID=UPI001CC6C0ED|nr:phosphatidylinositol 3,4,5-trisphosphate 3-phosphatase and protein-tyrosine-phosphatase PTEN2A-like [Telopea speciosissima]
MDSPSSPPVKAPDAQHAAPTGQDTARDAPSLLSASGISSWARSLKIPQPSIAGQEDLNSGKSTFSRFTSGFGMRSPPKAPSPDESVDGASTTAQPGVFGSFTKGLVDSSMSAVKAVQVKARHIVSQNKRRYQEGGFDLDMTYITENIIAMGFPAGDMSSGFFGYFEGFYRNHMEEVIKFFETHHKGNYKVYNLCSERLYDASLFEGKVACFPFDDHNCPPLQLVLLFCQSAYSWLKEDIENVVVVHCKAGMARTGLMISSLLLYLKFFPTAEESIDYYNQKRCLDGKGLVLPSQIRYVKYFECILKNFNGENQPGRRCMLRGFRLHRCPYWIRPSITVSDHNGILFSTKKHPRTKDLMPEDFWFTAPKKGIMVFALPGEPGLTEVAGDFKIHFHDRQGDFYCWLNTTMTENRKILNTSDLDGFDKRKLPSPGFQVEVVMIDYDGTIPTTPKPETANKVSDGSSGTVPAPADGGVVAPDPRKGSGGQDKDDVFSDSEAEESGSSESRQNQAVSGVGGPATSSGRGPETRTTQDQIAAVTHGTEQVSLRSEGTTQIPSASEVKTDEGGDGGVGSGTEVSKIDSSDFKPIAADASVFTFGDEDDYESE